MGDAMRRRPFAAAAAVVLLLGCAEAEAPPARPPVAEPAVPSPEASCERTVLKNPLFGIADPAPLAEISRPIPHQIPGAGGPQAMWAWRSASDDPPRWERLEAPSAVYLSAGQALSQSGLGLPAGRWRLIVGAALGGDRAAGLRMELEGDPGGPFEIEALGAPTLHVAEIDLPEGVDRLILTGLGPGEIKLIMACLVPIV
jgi:hypothetical protein